MSMICSAYSLDGNNNIHSLLANDNLMSLVLMPSMNGANHSLSINKSIGTQDLPIQTFSGPLHEMNKRLPPAKQPSFDGMVTVDTFVCSHSPLFGRVIVTLPRIIVLIAIAPGNGLVLSHQARQTVGLFALSGVELGESLRRQTAARGRRLRDQ